MIALLDFLVPFFLITKGFNLLHYWEGWKRIKTLGGQKGCKNTTFAWLYKSELSWIPTEMFHNSCTITNFNHEASTLSPNIKYIFEARVWTIFGFQTDAANILKEFKFCDFISYINGPKFPKFPCWERKIYSCDFKWSTYLLNKKILIFQRICIKDKDEKNTQFLGEYSEVPIGTFIYCVRWWCCFWYQHEFHIENTLIGELRRLWRITYIHIFSFRGSRPISCTENSRSPVRGLHGSGEMELIRPSNCDMRSTDDRQLLQFISTKIQTNYCNWLSE